MFLKPEKRCPFRAPGGASPGIGHYREYPQRAVPQLRDSERRLASDFFFFSKVANDRCKLQIVVIQA